MNVTLPGARAWPAMPREFYVFLQQVAQGVNGANSIDLTDITKRLSAIEDQGAGGSVRGVRSLQYTGVLPGIVTLSLVNDAAAPGNTYFYGTDTAGAKGWYTIASTLAHTADVTLVVGTDGVSTIGLADLADSGTGAALVKLTRDAKGRLSGTSAATTSDLTEGANLYYTDARADARIDAFQATFASLPNAVDDAAAAAAGVAVGGMYRNGSTLQVRIA